MFLTFYPSADAGISDPRSLARPGVSSFRSTPGSGRSSPTISMCRSKSAFQSSSNTRSKFQDALRLNFTFRLQHQLPLCGPAGIAEERRRFAGCAHLATEHTSRRSAGPGPPRARTWPTMSAWARSSRSGPIDLRVKGKKSAAQSNARWDAVDSWSN